MKKKRFLKSMKIEAPCTEEWDDMTGNDRVRFCSHCAKDVNNLSAMTRREALRLVSGSRGQICMRYIIDPRTNTPMFSEQLIQIVRRAPRMAAGVMTASLSLSAMAYAQGGSRKPAPEVSSPAVAETAETTKKTSEREEQKTGVIRGMITDKNGAVIPEVEIKLFGKGEDPLMATTSGYDGTYKFEGLASGRYRVVIEAEKFTQYTSSLRISTSEDRVEDIELVPQRIISGAGISLMRISDRPRLITAVAMEEIEEVTSLLAAVADANVRDEDDGRTAIYEAIADGNLEMVELLLKFGAKFDVEDDEKLTPLMMVDDNASLELVQLLLKKGSKVNAVAKEGDTALIRLAREVKPEILQALLDAGAEIDIQNKEGVSALMNAADVESFENVKLLVLAGADINLRDEEGDNAWDYTAEDEIEAFLVAHGVQLDPGEAEDIDHDVKRWLNGDYEEPAGDDLDGDGDEDEPISK